MNLFITIVVVFLVGVVVYNSLRTNHKDQKWLTDFSRSLPAHLEWEKYPEALDLSNTPAGIKTGSGSYQARNTSKYPVITNIQGYPEAMIFNRSVRYEWNSTSATPVEFLKLVVRIPRKNSNHSELYVLSRKIQKSPLPQVDDLSYASSKDEYVRLNQKVNFKILQQQFTDLSYPSPSTGVDFLVTKNSVEIQIDDNVLFVNGVVREKLVKSLLEKGEFLQKVVDKDL